MDFRVFDIQKTRFSNFVISNKFEDIDEKSKNHQFHKFSTIYLTIVKHDLRSSEDFFTVKKHFATIMSENIELKES